MTECRRLVLLQKKMAGPCESISDRQPEKCPPGVAQSKCPDDDRNAQARTTCMHEPIRGVAVLLHVVAEEIIVISKFLRPCHARHRSLAHPRLPDVSRHGRELPVPG